MEDQKRIVGWRDRRRRFLPASDRPYYAKLIRDHGGGLWTFEGENGQLYLAVLKKGFQPVDGATRRVSELPFASEDEAAEYRRAELKSA